MYDKFDIEILEKIKKLLSYKDINFNVNFIFMIENFWLNNMSYENKIVNMISIIEKLLINKNEGKQEAFKLKVGIIIRNSLKMNDEKISKLLKAIYELRSLLVHGEDDEIYNNKERYSELFQNDTLLNLNNKIEIRDYILRLFYKNVENITKIVLNKYLDDVKFCEFLKNN